jgi:hypothetical protein
VANVDLEIVKRAREILDSPSKWNRAYNRVCPETAKTFSLYCALDKATTEKTGSLSHPLTFDRTMRKPIVEHREEPSMAIALVLSPEATA